MASTRPLFKRPRWWHLDWRLKVPPHIKDYDLWKQFVESQHNEWLQHAPAEAGATGKQRIDLEMLEKQYARQVGLYDKYLDLLIKLNVFHIAVTGAIVSFYFGYIGKGPVKWSLLFPILMSAFFAVLTYLAHRSLKVINQEIIYIAYYLGFQPPSVRTLRHALYINLLLLVVIVIGLTFLFFFGRALLAPPAQGAPADSSVTARMRDWSQTPCKLRI